MTRPPDSFTTDGVGSTVCGAGHMVAGDRIDLFTGAVVEFLARHAEGR